MKNILLLAVLFSFISCSAKKQSLFYAFTDGFMDWYELKLFHDSSFDLHIPSVDYSGFYRIDGDSIFLSYKEKQTGDIPQAYLINTKKQKIDELILFEGTYIIRQDNNRWIQIVNNNLPNDKKKPQ
ncbi:hypothetical protein ESA94_18045 [Lacibacter luteus]|uniref:Lipoprotein n=1 Tax=Lacibacter luteus TaxID=2508719 RepID=A0A4Q1CF57_9BACT|nr:hypothetical protein [Lacibacter luteus]RXK58534.1 hypothetical protein ESA94_18045 [Lacibacter luteus]